MKRQSLLLLLLMLVLGMQAQTSMRIYRKGGQISKVYLNNVDQIEFVDETAGAAGDGTEQNPYNPAGAIKKVFETEEDTRVSFFVKGYITNIDEVSTEYGNATFTICGDREGAGTTIHIYRTKGLGNMGFTNAEEIALGDDVVVYTTMTQRNGIPVSYANGYIYSLNGNTEPTIPQYESDGTLSNPFTPQDAINYCKSLGADNPSADIKYVKGKVVSIREPFTAIYGNCTFTISSDGINPPEFFAYRVLYLNNQRWTEGNRQLNIGDEVILCAKLTYYKGTTPETYNGYIYSINGNTTEQDITPVAGNANANDASLMPLLARLEFPKVKGGASRIVTHKNNDAVGINYSVEWDTQKKSQRWSCYQLSAESRVSKTTRYQGDEVDGQYPFDPELSSYEYFSFDPFRGSGYDHGHICPSADRLYSYEANKQTFYLTNMQPQLHNFNAGIWERMETFVRQQIGTYSGTDTLYVCKGGCIDQADKISTTLSNGLIVPRYYYMALLMKNSQGYKALGFWVDQTASNTDTDLASYVVSISELEQLTGIDFFCNLPDNTEQNVEQIARESICKAWGL